MNIIKEATKHAAIEVLSCSTLMCMHVSTLNPQKEIQQMIPQANNCFGIMTVGNTSLEFIFTVCLHKVP